MNAPHGADVRNIDGWIFPRKADPKMNNAPVQRIAIEHRCHIDGSFSEYESTYYNVADIQDFEPSFTNAEIANVLDQLYRYGDAYEFFTSDTGRLLETVIYRLRSI